MKAKVCWIVLIGLFIFTIGAYAQGEGNVEKPGESPISQEAILAPSVPFDPSTKGNVDGAISEESIMDQDENAPQKLYAPPQTGL